MYQILKNIATGLIPRQFLFANEEKLRRLYSFFYSGNQCECNICGKNLKRFVATSNGDLLCPNCGSLQRNRRLWQLLQTEFVKPEMAILDFSPSRCLYRKMKNISGIDYQSTDLSGDFIADHRYDITNIEVADNTFDLIICYHILEHIPNDALAMKELLRVLKPGAKVLIQTPFKEGGIYENESVVNEKERLKHFGQEDHVRIYSVEGLKQRLETSGFSLDVRKHHRDDHYGLGNETILVTTKP